eukprot:6740705-Prymnesium_polylepis.1
MPRVFYLALLVCAAPVDAIPGRHTTGPPESTVPLIQALVDANVTLALSLLDGGADLDARDVITPMYAAQEYVRSSKQRHMLLHRMLRRGAPVDGPTQDGTTVRLFLGHCTTFRAFLPCTHIPSTGPRVSRMKYMRAAI